MGIKLIHFNLLRDFFRKSGETKPEWWQDLNKHDANKSALLKVVGANVVQRIPDTGKIKKDGDNFGDIAWKSGYWTTDKPSHLSWKCQVELDGVTQVLLFPCAPKPMGGINKNGYPKIVRKKELQDVGIGTYGDIRPWRLLIVDSNLKRDDTSLTEVTGKIETTIRTRTLDDGIYTSIADMIMFLQTQKGP